MKKIVILSLILMASVSAFGFDLKPADILVQPLKCWSCSLIEAQENSDYSHIAIVVKKDEKLFALEAYGSVKLTPMDEFIKRTDPERKILVRRLKNKIHDLESHKTKILNIGLNFVGHPYDRNFLWDNFVNGKEAIYCSELLYKMFNPYINFFDLAPKVMDFDINPDLWDRYFRGETPRGEIGISPEDFAKSSDFKTMGEM